MPQKIAETPDYSLGSLALSIRSRTHLAPPSLVNFSFWGLVILMLTGIVSSPCCNGLRPWPRPAPPWVGLSDGILIM